MKQEQANKMTMHQRELDVHRQGKREDLQPSVGLTALGAAFRYVITPDREGAQTLDRDYQDADRYSYNQPSGHTYVQQTYL